MQEPSLVLTNSFMCHTSKSEHHNRHQTRATSWVLFISTTILYPQKPIQLPFCNSDICTFVTDQSLERHVPVFVLEDKKSRWTFSRLPRWRQVIHMFDGVYVYLCIISTEQHGK